MTLVIKFMVEIVITWATGGLVINQMGKMTIGHIELLWDVLLWQFRINLVQCQHDSNLGRPPTR